MRLLISCAVLLGVALAAAASEAPVSTAKTREPWPHYRGVNGGPMLTDQDIDALAQTGANLLRLSFTAEMPLVQRTPPYAYNEEAFQRLDAILRICEARHIAVVIDPHSSPGTVRPYTMTFEDEFWRDERWHTILIDLWRRLATTYKDRGPVIAGYDLLNEPVAPDGFDSTGPGGWNRLAARLVRTIREAGDTEHTIIIEPAAGRIDGKYVDRISGLAYLQLPDDPKLVVSPHMYRPHPFTHQGVEAPVGAVYPGKIGKEEWNAEKLEAGLQAIVAFQQRTGCPIFIGEFSVSRAAGVSGETYLKDVIGLFERHGWAWAYHDFRGSHHWDSELPYDAQEGETQRRSFDAPRMRLLREAMAANRPAPVAK